MNKNKFDGPSFINPQHTSYGLNDGKNYQAAKIDMTESRNIDGVNVVKKELGNGFSQNRPISMAKKAPRGGWEDDESLSKKDKIQTGRRKSDSSNSNFSCANTIHNTLDNYKGISNLTVSNNSSTNNNQNNISNISNISDSHAANTYTSAPYINYWDSENTKKIQNSTLSVEYENKLIDEILQPTGVTVKPSDTQIKEFLKRLKVLNKEIVLKIIFERLENHQNFSDIRILQRLLYIIVATITEKIEGYFESYKENRELFVEIQQFYANTKKVLELTNEILELLNSGGIANLKNQFKNTNYKISQPINLLEIGKEIQNSTKDRLNNFTFIKKGQSHESNNINDISDKSSSLSREKENKSKFKFLIKKGSAGNNSNLEDTEVEIKSKGEDLSNFNKLSDNFTVKNTEKNFSFIKSTKCVNKNNIIDVHEILKLNLNSEVCSGKDNKKLFDLDNELSKVFGETVNITNTDCNFNYNVQIQNNKNFNPVLINNINNNQRQYPDNFDSLFDMKLLNTPSESENSALAQNEKKDHFAYILKDMMKPKSK